MSKTYKRNPLNTSIPAANPPKMNKKRVSSKTYSCEAGLYVQKCCLRKFENKILFLGP